MRTDVDTKSVTHASAIHGGARITRTYRAAGLTFTCPRRCGAAKSAGAISLARAVVRRTQFFFFIVGAEGCRGELHGAKNDSRPWIVVSGLAR